MKNDVVKQLFGAFTAIAKTHDGVEYWHARQLQETLGYAKWDNFLVVIAKAKTACQKSGRAFQTILPTSGKWWVSAPEHSDRWETWLSPATPAI